MDFLDNNAFTIVYWCLGGLYSYSWVHGSPSHLSSFQRCLLISLSIVGWPFIFMTEFILNGSYRAEVEFRVNDVKDLLEEKAFTAGFNAGVHSALTDEDEENAGPVVMIPREKQEEFMAMVEQLTGQKIERPPEKPLTPSEDDVE